MAEPAYALSVPSAKLTVSSRTQAPGDSPGRAAGLNRPRKPAATPERKPAPSPLGTSPPTQKNLGERQACQGTTNPEPSETSRSFGLIESNRKHGQNVSRPLHTHRFAVELDLVAAGDMANEALAAALLDGATAGLRGLVANVRWCELDGKRHSGLPQAEGGAIHRLRPAPDERFGIAVGLVEDALRHMRSALGRSASIGSEQEEASS